MLAIFALAGFLFIPGFFNRDMWDAQLRAPTDAVDDQHVKLTQKTVNGILLVFPGWVGKCIERSSLRSRRLWCPAGLLPAGLVPQERQFVRLVRHKLCQRHPCAVPALEGVVQQDGTVSATGGLHAG